jgi:hypothetical protein
MEVKRREARHAGKLRDAEIGGHARQHPVDRGLIVDRGARLEGERGHAAHMLAGGPPPVLISLAESATKPCASSLIQIKVARAARPDSCDYNHS